MMNQSRNTMNEDAVNTKEAEMLTNNQNIKTNAISNNQITQNINFVSYVNKKLSLLEQLYVLVPVDYFLSSSLFDATFNMYQSFGPYNILEDTGVDTNKGVCASGNKELLQKKIDLMSEILENYILSHEESLRELIEEHLEETKEDLEILTSNKKPLYRKMNGVYVTSQMMFM